MATDLLEGTNVWRVVYVATGESMAQKIKNTLTDEGFLVMLRSTGSRQSDPQRTSKGPVEVLVPEAEVEEALERITEIVASGC